MGEISEKEAVVGGNVGSTLWLFETQPMDTLKYSYEVGQLKKVWCQVMKKAKLKTKGCSLRNSVLVKQQVTVETKFKMLRKEM